MWVDSVFQNLIFLNRAFGKCRLQGLKHTLKCQQFHYSIMECVLALRMCTTGMSNCKWRKKVLPHYT